MSSWNNAAVAGKQSPPATVQYSLYPRQMSLLWVHGKHSGFFPGYHLASGSSVALLFQPLFLGGKGRQGMMA